MQDGPQPRRLDPRSVRWWHPLQRRDRSPRHGHPALTLVTFPEAEPFASELGDALKHPIVTLTRHRFPDRETLIQVPATPAKHAVLVDSLVDPNPKLFELLLAADALRRAGAQRVSLVAPYLPYMRQDRVFHSGEPISQLVLGRLLSQSFDHVVTVEPHLHRIASLDEAFSCEATAVEATEPIAAWIRRASENALIIGPDAESQRWVRRIANRVGVPWAVAEKTRSGDRQVSIDFPRLPWASKAVIVDDIASSGATLAAAAASLRSRGIDRIEVVVVHAIFSAGAAEKIRAAGVDEIVSCDSVSHSTNRISLAPSVAEVLRGVSVVQRTQPET